MDEDENRRATYFILNYARNAIDDDDAIRIHISQSETSYGYTEIQKGGNRYKRTDFQASLRPCVETKAGSRTNI